MKKTITLIISLLMLFTIGCPIVADDQVNPSDSIEERTGNTEVSEPDMTAVVNLEIYAANGEQYSKIYEDKIEDYPKENNVFDIYINRFEYVDNNCYEFSKAFLKRVTSDENGSNEETIEFEIHEEYFDIIWIKWTEEADLSDSDYEFELYYNSVDSFPMEVDTLNDDNKSSIIFGFNEEDLSEVLKTSAKYASFFNPNDPENKTNLDLSNIYQIDPIGHFTTVYALDLPKKIDSGVYSMQIYVPGYSDYRRDVNFNPKFALTQELYDFESNEYIETELNMNEYHDGEYVYIQEEYTTKSNDIYKIKKVVVNDTEININEYGDFSFEMPGADTTVKLFGTLQTRGLDVRPSASYTELNGVIVKTLNLHGNIEQNKELYLNGTLTFVDENNGTEKSFKLSEFNKDDFVVREYEDGNGVYIYYLNDEKFAYLNGNYKVILSMDGYTDSLSYAVFGKVHKLTIKYYLEGAFIEEERSHVAEDDKVWLTQTKNGIVERYSGLCTIDKIVVSKDDFANNIKTNKFSSNEDGKTVEYVSYLYQMGTEDVTVSVYYKSNKIEDAYGGIDETLHSTILNEIKNNDAKIRGDGQDITQEIIDSLNLITTSINSSKEENIKELDTLKDRISVAVGNGTDKTVSYISIFITATNSTNYLNVYEFKNPIEVKIVLDDETYNAIKDKDNIKVVREHFDENYEVSYDILADADVKLEGRVLTIRSDKFSTFAVIGYNNPPSTNTGSSSSGSSSSTTVTRKPVVNTAAK